jgi:hypothetical protein
MHFSYHSQQVHCENGKTRRNIVTIKNGKGQKIVEKKIGNKKTRKVMPLKKHEMQKIRKNIFIPNLFAPERQIRGRKGN